VSSFLASYPGRARARGPAALAAGAVLLVGLFVGGCYNPTIKGTFKCNPEYKAGQGDCPEGYHCSAGLCVKGDAGIDLVPETKPEAHPETSPLEVAPEVPPVDTMPDTGACYSPVAGCTGDSGKKCDPVCQTGCGCHEKCSANGMGTLTCNMPLASRPRALGESCDISSLNAAAQTDNCAPGLVCLNDACGTRCYHFCKTDADCPMSSCTRDTGTVPEPPGPPTGIKVCDVQLTTCNPINNGQPSGCGADVQGCYLLTTGTDRTVCDCPFQAGGTNSSCSISRDCFPGLVCVDVNGTGNALCRPVCGVGANNCMGGMCTPLKGSTKFGYCN
jgi:hypothetical protein